MTCSPLAIFVPLSNVARPHTRATFLVEDGMGKDYLQVFLGHDQSGTTEIYTKTAALNTYQAFRKVVNDKSMN